MVLFLLVLSMWHLWGITSKISVQYCQLVVIVVFHPFTVNAVNHLC